jgi:hypothetical protein
MSGQLSATLSNGFTVGLANIGIVTGEISNLIVLDIDPKHGGDATLERLERRFGISILLAPPVLPGIVPGWRRASICAAMGDMVVAPPSIYPSGRPYRWV